jgi:hypothetical protein
VVIKVRLVHILELPSFYYFLIIIFPFTAGVNAVKKTATKKATAPSCLPKRNKQPIQTDTAALFFN